MDPVIRQEILEDLNFFLASWTFDINRCICMPNTMIIRPMEQCLVNTPAKQSSKNYRMIYFQDPFNMKTYPFQGKMLTFSL